MTGWRGRARCAWSVRGLAALCLCAVAALPAAAATRVRVLETWPAGDAVTLGRNQNFYLRLAFETDEPVGIWITPYADGREVAAGTSPSPTHTGSGETFAWFFFMAPGAVVDEIRIRAGNGGTAGTPVVATWHGRVAAGEAPAAGAPPDWVTQMKARAQAAQDEAHRARLAAPVSAGEQALFSGFMLAMLALGVGGFAAPLAGAWRWRGGWRLAALLPAAWMGFVVLRIVVDTSRDPTSHNLWPFEILIAGGKSLVAMALLAGLRRFLPAR